MTAYACYAEPKGIPTLLVCRSFRIAESLNLGEKAVQLDNAENYISKFHSEINFFCFTPGDNSYQELRMELIRLGAISK
jgi:hypothetical protein